jgi:hypothetical protein
VRIGEGDAEDEPLGTKEKFWVENPEDGTLWLFKYAREIDGRVMGEDWAEWLVHGIGASLGIPTADLRPAVCESRRGIVSRSVVPPNGRLVHGNSLLAENLPSYEPARRRENSAYTVKAVLASLQGAGAPPQFEDLAYMSAFEIWAAYLLLDALVAGRDRHHENWGIINDAGNRYIAPSFDHGNALGFQELDEKRRRCLENPTQMLSWAARGRSHHFAGRPELVSLAHEAMSFSSEKSRDYWRVALANLSSDRMADMVGTIPSAIMSEATRSFVFELLQVNRKRLLHDYPGD